MANITRTSEGAEFHGLPHTRQLGEALVLSGPYKVEHAPNAYSFSRPSTLNIDWKAILTQINVNVPETNAGQLREYVEDAWGGGVPSDQTINGNGFDLDAAWPAFVPDATTTTNATLPAATQYPTFFPGGLLGYRLPPETNAALPIAKGCVFKVPVKNGVRWYQPIVVGAQGENYPHLADFLNGQWTSTWDTVTALVQVFHPGVPATDANAGTAQNDAKKDACTKFPSVDTVRADAATIERQYTLLKNEGDLATHFDARADEVGLSIRQAQVEVIPTLVEQFRELKNFRSDLKAKKRQLADAASDLNYQLFTEPKTVTVYQDGTGQAQPLDIEEGDLYVKSSRTATWITYQSVTRSSSGFFGLGASSRTYQVPVHNAITFDYFEKAVVDYDPWVEILQFYKSKGFETFLFRYTENGLLAADGATPDAVLKRCGEDEAFRLRCVIALPQKEITLIGEAFVNAYNIFIRPVPDIVVTSFPEISIKERLSYRFTWRGVSLGELATTIPLSPGEEREVTLKTSERYNSSRSETASSLVDITRIDRADFETVFEKEVRKENSTTTNVSADVSGSYAGISGSASFSKSTTTAEVARQLNRSVQRASQEVNRRSKDERTVTVSESIETTRENTTSFKVRNINEGSTLNIAFYRLYNGYESVLKLDDFEYVVRAGKSFFASSDLVNERVFARDKLMDLVAWISDRHRFPFRIDTMTNEQKVAFAALIHDQVLEKYRQYPPPPPKDEEQDDVESARLVDEEMTAKPVEAPQPLSAEALDIGSSDDDAEMKFRALPRSERIDLVQHGLRSLAADVLGANKTLSAARISFGSIDAAKQAIEDDIIGLPFWREQTTFAYDSGGLYVDVYVGHRPATERYSENMRRLEEGRVERENRLLDARSRYLEARASKQILGLSGVFDATKVFVTERDELIRDDGHVEIKLRLVPGLLWDRGWSIIIATTPNLEGGSFLQDTTRVDGILIFELPRRFGPAGKDNIIGKPHSWYRQNITLRNEDLGITIKYKEP
ncbi:hypothetical protein PX860_22860 [Agrobacterium leguminum]|uniref:hypothetical protein n=1 Tax=Agrobacterium leguminum TaxID=2792015 RepID=UPI00272B016C|nr:hypothetical protein [Agrobacterium leguminum]WLD99918.1 hypothetical protein PX860_22860 [Agrobacterium leguminum]